MNYIVDPRAGKDHLYLGMAQGYALIPHNAKNLVQDNYNDIWRGFKYNNTSSNNQGHPIAPNYMTSTMYYRTGYMSGGHPRIMPTGGSANTYTYDNVYATCEGALNHAMSLDDQHQPTTMKHVVKSDGTENLIHQTSHGYNGTYTYGVWHVWEDIKQNQTMHDTDPKAYTHEAVSGYYQANMHCYYHEGTNSMIAPLNAGNTGTNYVEMKGGVHKWPLNISPDDTDNATNYWVHFPGAAQGKASHMIGISEIDGNPIFLQTNSVGDHHYAVYKYNPASHTITTLLSFTGSMTAAATAVNGVGGKRTSSGTYGLQTISPSKWITSSQAGTGGYNKRLFFVPNWDSNGRLTPTIILWDPGADTFTLGGNYPGTADHYNGPPRVYNSSGGDLTGTEIQTRQLPLGHTDLAGAANNISTLFVAEIHGAYHWAGDLQTEPNEGMLGFKNISSGNSRQYLTTFNVAGGHGVADSDTRYRSLLVFQNRARAAFDYVNFWGKVDVPETIRNFMWLNEERSRLMIIGASNSYIYQFGAVNTLNNSYTANTFTGPTYDQTNNNYSWTLTATLPGRYTHAAVDKYGRFIFQRMHEYHGATSGGVMEMYTESTPVTVDLTGNVTTDTITYSGSNFTKNLTVEAFNLFGKRIAASVNLIITGTDMQFDNGTQNKTITTSTSGGVLEIVTITGAGTSRISASYGT
jgi:hypothetical protein